MTELRLHRSLYASAAVEQAVATFAAHGTLERADDATHFVVKVTSKSDERARRIAHELGNWALGLTVRSRSGKP